MIYRFYFFMIGSNLEIIACLKKFNGKTFSTFFFILNNSKKKGQSNTFGGYPIILKLLFLTIKIQNGNSSKTCFYVSNS